MLLLPFLRVKPAAATTAATRDADRVDGEAIRRLLDRHKFAVKLALNTCARCTLCAESCFLHTSHPDDPSYMPSHKFLNSIGRLLKARGEVSRADLQDIADVVWGKCALCTRCYCPMRIDIPAMIALARDICRSQGIVPRFDAADSPLTGDPAEGDCGAAPRTATASTQG